MNVASTICCDVHLPTCIVMRHVYVATLLFNDKQSWLGMMLTRYPPRHCPQPQLRKSAQLSRNLGLRSRPCCRFSPLLASIDSLTSFSPCGEYPTGVPLSSFPAGGHRSATSIGATAHWAARLFRLRMTLTRLPAQRVVNVIPTLQDLTHFV